MAIHHISANLHMPESAGFVFQGPQAEGLVNDLYPGLVWIFVDTVTRDTLGFRFEVPQNYVGSPAFKVEYFTPASTGNYRAEIDYRAIADGETFDPATDQENLVQTIAVPGTARLLDIASIGSPTAGNFVVGDIVTGVLARDGAEAGPLDTVGARIYVTDLIFEYSDA